MRRLVCALLMVFLGGCVTSSSNKIDYSLDEQLQRGDVAYREARIDDAENIYRSITETHPDLKDVWFRLGNIYTRQEQLEAAVRAYQKALQIDHNDGRVWYNLSLVHMKQAIGTLELASQTLPADSPFRPRIAALHDSLLGRAGTQKQEEP